MRKFLLSLAFTLAYMAGAQTATVTPSAVQNLYGAGGSYSFNASPAVAGTAMYAHQIIAPTENYNGATYAFTVVDALPNNTKPFTVNTNIGVGIAQKVAQFKGASFYMPTSAGISFNGSNTGWQWNGGLVAAIPVKDGYYIMPTVRFLKSSVGNGTGYQPILGVLFGWGK